MMKQRALLPLLVFFGTLLTACQQEIGAPQAPAASFSRVDSAGACLPDSVHGTYTATQALDSTHFIDVRVRVIQPGPITLSTNSQNGISFQGSAGPAAPGTITVRLTGTGTPLAAGSTTLQLSGSGSACPLTVNVAAAPPGGGGPMAGPCFGTMSGVFKKDSVLGAGHRIAISHSFLASGTFRVHTDTVNGYSFSADVTVPVAGLLRVADMQATGTPAQVGSDTFTVRFGDGASCGFRVNVVAGTPPGGGGSTADTTMFPLAVGNWWSYRHPSLANAPTLIDSVKITVTGTKVIDGKTYFRCQRYSGASGPQSPFGTQDDTLYFRRDASGAVYQNIDLNAEYGWWNNYTFSNPARLELKLYEPGRAVGDMWYSDTIPTSSTGTGPIQVRVRSTVTKLNASATMTVNNLTGLYEVRLRPEMNDGTGWYGLQGYPNLRTKSFVRGIGMVAENLESQYAPLRYWHVQ